MPESNKPLFQKNKGGNPVYCLRLVCVFLGATTINYMAIFSAPDIWGRQYSEDGFDRLSQPTLRHVRGGDILNQTSHNLGVNNNQWKHSHHATGGIVDKRLEVNRPFMETVSHSIMDSIVAIEAAYPTDETCNKWGGSKFMDDLISSGNEVLVGVETKEPRSSIRMFRNHAVDVFLAQNVSIAVEMPSQYMERTEPILTLEANGQMNRTALAKTSGGSTVLEKMSIQHSEMQECSDFIEYPVMLVDSNIDTWNWWFFLQSILHHYIMVGTVQPLIMGEYEQDALRVMHTSNDGSYSRSFNDAFDILFSDRRSRDSRQIWKADSTNGIDSTDKGKRLCFRKLLWSPNFNGGGLLVNKDHTHQSCFSSIIYSYAAFIKAAMHIPTLPRPRNPRVVWVGRDTSDAANPTAWQKKRIISNQPQLIEFLKEECSKMGLELVVADFHGDKKDTSFEEQARFVARANIMIGMHGAGLNMFHFMPFNSVVIEIHSGTNANKNSRNFVNHIEEGFYISTNAKLNGRKIDEGQIWSTLKQGIDKWYSLA
mmetsp:Transcript_10564/g.23233  ORF Transcript_10564/g.23233 Transcript_10564/m.23233 type:complete len:539 (-) Transcript_10564:134-1750(-)